MFSESWNLSRHILKIKAVIAPVPPYCEHFDSYEIVYITEIILFSIHLITCIIVIHCIEYYDII